MEYKYNKYKLKHYTSGEHTLLDEEIKKLLSNTDTIDTYILLKLAITTGLRRGDIVKVKWDDVDFSNNKINFYEEKKNRVYSVYINDDMKQDLLRFRNTYPKEHYVFSGSTNKKYGKGHISSRTAYNKYQETLFKAGIQNKEDRRPFHSLRATCIKQCQRKGWTIEQTAKHVGDSIRVIQEHYSTPTKIEMREVANTKPLI